MILPQKRSRKISYGTRLPEDLVRRLKAVTARAGVSQAAVVEAGIRDCLKQLERRLRDETPHETHKTVMMGDETSGETIAMSVPETFEESHPDPPDPVDNARGGEAVSVEGPELPDPGQSPPDLLVGLQAMLGK